MTSTHITVHGHGTARTTPTHARFDLSVSALAPTPTEATATAHELASRIIETAPSGAAGVRSTSVHRQTQHHNGIDRFVGWRAQHHLALTVTLLNDTDEAFAVLNDLTKAQPNQSHDRELSINGPFWFTDDASEAHREARALAITEAQSKAQDFATAANLELGAIVSIEEGGGHQAGPPMRAMASFAASPPDVEDLTVRVAAMVTFEASPT